ncbi:hypothetical protein ACWCXK_37995 [Streptomyces sp. NPDC001739]
MSPLIDPEDLTHETDLVWLEGTANLLLTRCGSLGKLAAEKI